jgi:DHA2 family multidrug resistance protein-like MFS transporter
VSGRVTLPEPIPHDEPYDVLAAVLCALTFGLVISGLESIVHGDSPIVSLAVIAAGTVIGFIFVRRELREREPILPVDLLAIAPIRWSVIGAIFAFIASITVLLSLPFRLQQEFGFSPGEVGAMITPWPLGMMVLGPIAGILSDRFPAAILGSIGMALATIALVLLAFLPAAPQYFDLAWRMALAGAGFGLFLAPNARLIVGSAPPSRVASAGGMVSTTRLTGQAFGATIVGALLAMGFGANRVAALIAAGLALAAGICSAIRLRAADDARKPVDSAPL